MSTSDPKATSQIPAGFDAVGGYPLMEAIFRRRTRRTALGSEIPGSPRYSVALAQGFRRPGESS